MIPISARMRPEKLEEFVGQEHFLYEGSLLYNSIKRKNFKSAIFFGASGTGKTTLARIIAKEMNSYFREINATNTGIKEVKNIIDEAKLILLGIENKKTYLFVDEIHRWNKLQQDILLQATEEGVINLIASTTENPYFCINNALLSRVNNIYEFRKHKKENIKIILKKAIEDKEKGFGNLKIKYENKAIDIIAEYSNGDIRVALEKLGYIIDNLNEEMYITNELSIEATYQKNKVFNKEEDKYNLLSALQKSIRGSDPDASVFYLAQLIEYTQDITLINRRLLVIASEDIGMAYPSAITVVNSCVQASQVVGLPEARIILAEAVIFLASLPKSNSCYMAIEKALSEVKNDNVGEMPNYLKDNHYNGAENLGIKGYKYPHDFGGYIKQQYLPSIFRNEANIFYVPKNNGQEKSYNEFLKKLRKD